jgi:dihydrofolate synthase/folylpolyglutamate synthase
MTYAEAIRFLYDLRFFGARLGLENSFKLAALAGDPQTQLSFIHVAGTNGKGSTCAILESIYRTAGLRLGLYTSPHLVSFGERIQVDRGLISQFDITRLVGEMKSLLSGSTWDLGFPTFFEVVTILALRYFAEQKCDLVVWETGLGGRLDATNIVTPLASVITNVQLDHQQWLGDTLTQIASEKAGIIKPRIPVLTSAEEPEALRVLQDKARELHAPFTAVNYDETRRPPLDGLELPLLGEHQRLNAALALGVVRTLAGKIAISEQVIRTGLAAVDWPGRFQLIRLENGRKIVLDGAHNPAGITSLCAALHKHFPGEKPTVVFGVLHDKDFTAMCQLLAPHAKRFCLTPVSSERTADPEVLRATCQQANPNANAQVFSNPSDALRSALADPFVLVTGSLHFIGETMELLQVSPSPPSNERGLNEWMARP